MLNESSGPFFVGFAFHRQQALHAYCLVQRILLGPVRGPASRGLQRVVEFTLMSNGEYAYLIACRNEAVEGNVSRLPERNHKLPQLAAHPTSRVWVCSKHVNGTADRCGRRGRCRWIVLVEKQ